MESIKYALKRVYVEDFLIKLAVYSIVITLSALFGSKAAISLTITLLTVGIGKAVGIAEEHANRTRGK